MNPYLLNELNAAIEQSKDLHSRHIVRNYLPLFIRAARQEPKMLEPAIDILLDSMQLNRTNTLLSLYGLASLADVSNPMRELMKKKIPSDLVDYYAQDENKGISGNAIILREVLDGRHLSTSRSTEDEKSVTDDKVDLYVGGDMIDRLASKADGFDYSKLVSLLDELNDNWISRKPYSTAAILRAILDHIPPLFGQGSFEGVVNNYHWSKTDKKYMQQLSEARARSDDALHRGAPITQSKWMTFRINVI